MSRVAADKELRRATISEMLARRLSPGEIVRAVTVKYGVSASTVRKDIKAVYEVWAREGQQQQAGNLALAIENCLGEIRRLQHNLAGRPNSRGVKTVEFHPRDEFRYSTALLKWESHLAKLQGLLVGRVDVTTQGEPLKVVMSLPAGPYAGLEES